MRKIGLDIGAKSCGIALSDPLNITAQGQENFRFETHDWQTLIHHLKTLTYWSEVDEIIVGYPLLPSGDKSQTTLMIEDFVSLLTKAVKQKIIYEKEFGTTKRAHEVMIEAGLSRKKRKKHKDKLAAVLILQNYLDRISYGK